MDRDKMERSRKKEAVYREREWVLETRDTHSLFAQLKEQVMQTVQSSYSAHRGPVVVLVVVPAGSMHMAPLASTAPASSRCHHPHSSGFPSFVPEGRSTDARNHAFAVKIQLRHGEHISPSGSARTSTCAPARYIELGRLAACTYSRGRSRFPRDSHARACALNAKPANMRARIRIRRYICIGRGAPVPVPACGLAGYRYMHDGFGRALLGGLLAPS